MEPRTFYKSRNTGIWYLLGCLLIAGICCWGLLDPDVEISKKVFAVVVLVGAIVAFYLILKGAVIPAFKKIPALTIDERGIGLPEQHLIVSWEEVANVEMEQPYRHVPFIKVYVKDTDAIISRLRPSQQKNTWWLSRGYVDITPAFLAGEEDIFELIKKYYRHYGPYPNDVWFRRPGRETWPSE